MSGFSLPLPGVDESWGSDTGNVDPTRRRQSMYRQDDPAGMRSALANLSPWDTADFTPTNSGKVLGGAAPNNVSDSEMEQNAKKAAPVQTGDNSGRTFNPNPSLLKPDEQQEGPPNSGKPFVLPSSSGSSQFPDVSSQITKNQSQIDAMNKPMTGKQKIFNLLAMAAPVVAGGVFGGLPGAAGAAGGVTNYENTQNANKQKTFQLLTGENDRLQGIQERATQAQQDDQYKREALGLMKRPEVQQTPTGPIQYNPQTKTWSSVMVDGKPIGAKTPPQKFETPQQGYAAAVSDAISRNVDPATDPKVMQWKAAALGLQKDSKPDSPEQQYIDEFQRTHKGASVADAVSAYTSSTQKPERPQRVLGVGPDGKVMEITPGMTVPKGTKSISGELAGGKPTADEQKRADLVTNLNENLDTLEEIVNRRPDLFGKVAGRMTKLKEWMGSDDPDVAALKGIEDRIGMVAQSSHGMRSAQHVEASANSLLNGFKNGSDAMKRAISDARASGATFTEDVERAKGQSSGSNSSSGAPSTVAYKDGNDVYDIPKGKEVQFKLAHPKAVKQ